MTGLPTRARSHKVYCPDCKSFTDTYKKGVITCECGLKIDVFTGEIKNRAELDFRRREKIVKMLRKRKNHIMELWYNYHLSSVEDKCLRKKFFEAFIRYDGLLANDYITVVSMLNAAIDEKQSLERFDYWMEFNKTVIVEDKKSKKSMSYLNNEAKHKRLGDVSVDPICYHRAGERQAEDGTVLFTKIRPLLPPKFMTQAEVKQAQEEQERKEMEDDGTYAPEILGKEGRQLDTEVSLEPGEEGILEDEVQGEDGLDEDTSEASPTADASGDGQRVDDGDLRLEAEGQGTHRAGRGGRSQHGRRGSTENDGEGLQVRGMENAGGSEGLQVATGTDEPSEGTRKVEDAGLEKMEDVLDEEWYEGEDG